MVKRTPPYLTRDELDEYVLKIVNDEAGTKGLTEDEIAKRVAEKLRDYSPHPPATITRREIRKLLEKNKTADLFDLFMRTGIPEELLMHIQIDSMEDRGLIEMTYDIIEEKDLVIVDILNPKVTIPEGRGRGRHTTTPKKSKSK